MSPSKSLARIIRRNLSNRAAAPMLIAIVALLAAVVLSVSVESRNSGSLRKPQSSTPPSNSEVAKISTSSPATLKPNRSAARSAAITSPFVPTVTATKADSLLTDVDMDGQADPGDTLRYTVAIGVTGMDATGVMFTDMVDANTAFVPGSLMTTPLARPDAYSATGNIRISIAAPGVLGNDQDFDGVGPALNVTAGTFLSTQGGNVNLSADGSFTYNPPAGFEGADTFNYTLNDGEGPSDTGTVSITVSGMIWFINNNATSCLTVAAGCGRLTNPFSTLAAFATANIGGGNNPAANDNIFVYESATSYVGPLTLLSGQKFIGQDATGASLAALAGVTLAPNSDALPGLLSGNATLVTITSGGIGIGLGSNNTLRGFTGGNASTDIDGSGFGTLTVADVSLNGTGRALNLATGSLSATFGIISSTDSGTTGVTLSGVSGSLTTPTTTVTNSALAGISVQNSSATLSFGATTSNQSGGAGVFLDNNTGAITFGALNIAPDANQRGLHATNNSNTITTTSGTISTSTANAATNAAAVEITRVTPNTTPLNIQLTSVSTNGGTNGIILTNTTATGVPGGFNVVGTGSAGTGGTIQNTSSNGVAFTTVASPSLNWMTIDNSGDNGIFIDAVSGLNLANLAMDSNGAQAEGGAVHDAGIHIEDLIGPSNSISNSTIQDSRNTNLDWDPNSSSGMSTLTVTNTNLNHAGEGVVGQGNAGINLVATGTANVKLVLSGGQVRNNAAAGILITGGSGTTVQTDIDAVDMISSQPPAVAPGVNPGNTWGNGVGTNFGISLSSTGTAIQRHEITNVQLAYTGIAPSDGGSASAIGFLPAGTGSFHLTLTGNTIGLVGQARSGNENFFGIAGDIQDSPLVRLNITSNTVRNTALNGIFIQTRDPGALAGAVDADLTLRTNTVGPISDDDDFPFGGAAGTAETHAIRIESRNDSNLCMDINGNSGDALSVNQDYLVRQRDTSIFSLERLAANTNVAATVEAFIVAQNPAPAGQTARATIATQFTAVADGTCQNPILPSSLFSQVDSMLSDDNSSNVSDILWTSDGKGTERSDIPNLTQSQLESFAQAALERWRQAGISAEDSKRLQRMTFEIEDLPDGQLAVVTSGVLKIDPIAAGFGWYLDPTPAENSEFNVLVYGQERQTTERSPAFGKMDLLTVLTRGLGRALGNQTQLEGGMAQATLDTGVRRTVVTDWTPSEAVDDNPAINTSGNGPTRAVDTTSVKNSDMANSGGMPTDASLNDVSLNIGLLPAGKTITVKFDVTVDNPWAGLTNQVCNQGTVTADGGISVLTDDTSVGGPADPTCTTIDQPDVTVAVAPASVPEDGGTNLVYTFTREGSTAAALTVNFTVAGTASSSTDYTVTGAATFDGTNGTVTIPMGSSVAAINVDPTADITVESDETVSVSVAGGTSYDVGTPGSANGTITNDDTDVTLAVSPSSVEEDGAGNLVYTFTRNGVTSGALTVNFTIDGTATFGASPNDYTQTGAASFVPPNGTVNFTAGSTTATVTINPETDNVVEPNETVVLTLATGTGYNVANPSMATGTITNDDAEVTLAVSPSEVEEDGATNLVYTFTRTGDITGALVVNFTISGTATFGATPNDYTQTGATTFAPPNGTVTFGAGSSTATITVNPETDTTSEPNETVILTLATGADYNVGTPSEATGTINNDDTSVSVAVSPLSTDEDGLTNLDFTFTRSDASGALTVNFSVGGTATFGASPNDYTQTGAASFTPPNGTVTFADGSLTATVTVDPVADSVVESDETVMLTVTAGVGYIVGVPASATGTITNDDTDVSVAVAPTSTLEDGAGTLVYTFTRVGVTTGALTVNFSIGGTATFNDDYSQTGADSFDPPTGTVTFGAGSSTAMVTVDPSADTTVESDETVTLTVASGTGYNVAAINNSAMGTITNDDTDVSIAVAPSSVNEDGATNLVYTFTRVGVTGSSLVVNFTIGGTATFGVSPNDYTQTGATSFTPPTGTVTFGAGNSTATITVNPETDTSVEPDETVMLTLAAGTGYNVVEPSSATGTILDDDITVSVAVSPGAVDEDGVTNLVYTFTRTDPDGELTANFMISGTATFGASPNDYTQTGAASFTPPNGTVTFADGSLTATVTVDPETDNIVEPDETVILTVVAGPGYGVGTPSQASGTITNDDTDVSVAVAPTSTLEDGAGNLVYTFTRNGVTSTALTVNFSVGGTADPGSDYTQTGAASFTPPTGTVTFSPGSLTATVMVDPTADGTAEGDETVILTLTGGTGYNVASPSVATGTITNDDTEVSVAVSPSSALEDGATNMVFTFTRVGITSGALTINFSVGGTAIFAPPGGDYTQIGADTFVNAGTGTVTFLAGSSTATVTVDPFGDADLEPDETVILTVIAGAGYTVGTPSSATGTILNDDNSPPTIVVGYGQCGGVTTGTLNLLVGDVETPAGSLTLSATSSNTAVVPLANISFGGSGANRTITIQAVAQATVQFSDVTVTVTDGNGLMTSINIRVIVGTNQKETINIGTTTVGSDMIFGGNGDDTINAGAGNDLVCGGNSGGIINGGLGDDTLDGGNGNDTLRGGDGNDLLIGGNGTDTLEGGNNDDTLTGGSGPDFFNGGPGTDTATDFTPGQGDTQDGSVEVAALLRAPDWQGVFAYLALPRWWVSPFSPLWPSHRSGDGL